ncbi:MAG: hypothetical protein COB53_00200 [Elusimicrobia bacterium]|nr:MAG: hypothetical protein COB53_00200 [Elusimicrobiota bacterium]
MKKVFVTGGAGFIGSHIVDHLAEKGARVTVYDNFSAGKNIFLKSALATRRVKIVKGDVLNLKRMTAAMRGHDAVFHFAANADVRGGTKDTRVDLEQNTIATHRVLEAMRAARAKKLVFASSAVVYGEPQRFPTPEEYAGIQTSVYGASKLAGEAMIQAYGNYFGIRSWSFRFVSWIGERYTHGVVYDFVKKLRKNGKVLPVLGDGRQRKSYLYVKDGVEGIFRAITRGRGLSQIYNLGHRESMGVDRLARIVASEMDLHGVRIRHSGGVRGWVGDSPVVRLSTRRMSALGWSAQTKIEVGIRRTVRYLMETPEALAR